MRLDRIGKDVPVKDLFDIDRIWRENYANQFGIPNLDHMITQGVVKDGERFLGYGVVKGFAEMFMILNPDTSRKEKVQMVAMLIDGMKNTVEEYEQVHCFVNDYGFADILIEHFGFVPCTGRALVLNLERG